MIDKVTVEGIVGVGLVAALGRVTYTYIILIYLSNCVPKYLAVYY